MHFSDLAAHLKILEETTSRNRITEFLAELFAKAGNTEIGSICYLLQGRVAPLYEAVEFGVAEKFIIRAVAAANSIDPDTVKSAYKKHGDIGTAAELLHRGSRGDMEVQKVYETLKKIAEAHGQGSQEQKISLLSDMLSHVSALSARYIVRIPLDKLRLGFSELTILDALSWMLSGDKSHRKAIEEAYHVHPDIAYIAQTIKSEGVKGLSDTRARVGHPVLAQLSQRLPTADEMIKKMGEVAVEPKYDGVRVQIHFWRTKKNKKKAEIQTFSRNLENTTAMFPELETISPQVAADAVILDGEAVGLDPGTGKLLPFQETTTRKRKHDIDAAKGKVPLRFYIFDILYKNGADLLRKPLSERREILENTIRIGNVLSVSPQIVTGSPKEIRQYHDTQIKIGLEGVVVKKWNSPYEPGRRGYSWVKFKEEEGKTGKLTDTIDAVVMGYYLGEGKRTGFGIGALLVGVRKGDTFVTVTKIGTGVSDELWKTLRSTLQHVRVKTKPAEFKDVDKLLVPDVWTTPEVVIEVAGDDLTKSPAHGAGFAVRFPRLVRVRTDKAPLQVTTTGEIVDMYTQQFAR